MNNKTKTWFLGTATIVMAVMPVYLKQTHPVPIETSIGILAIALFLGVLLLQRVID